MCICACEHACVCVLCRLMPNTWCTEPQSFLTLISMESVVRASVCAVKWLPNTVLSLGLMRLLRGKISLAVPGSVQGMAFFQYTPNACVCVPFPSSSLHLYVVWYPMQALMDTPTTPLTPLLHQSCRGGRDSLVAQPSSWSSMLQQTQQL